MTGLIFSIVRASVHDGPGIRTVIYHKGCTMRCAWCHNPEGLSPRTEIMYYPERCIGCGRCAGVCPEHISGGFRLPVCRHCGQCAESCPSGALSAAGKRYDADELMKIILRDRRYYEKSGGGVTFSGGECLMQSDFVAYLADECKKAGIHTALETALYVGEAALDAVIGKIDLFYVDLKHMDPGKHKKFTGCDNRLILSNFRRLSARHDNIIVRIPLIPGVNDDETNLHDTARFIADCRGGVRAVELLKYNELAGGKYAPLGLDIRPSEAWRAQTDAQMIEKRAFMRSQLPENIEVI